MKKTIEPLTRVFGLNRVVLPRHATALFQIAGYGLLDDLLTGHSLGSWGKVTAQTARSNDRALLQGRGAIRSAHELKDGTEVFIVTDGEWRETTVFLLNDFMDLIYSMEG